MATRGCCSIDRVPTASAVGRGPRDGNFDVLGFCARNSSESLGAAILISALIRWGLGSNRASTGLVRFLSSCDRGSAVAGGVVLGCRSRLHAHPLLQFSCPIKVAIGHECQLCFVPAIRACPRQGETPLRLRAIICAHRHRRSLLCPKLTMREYQTHYDIYVNCG